MAIRLKGGARTQRGGKNTCAPEGHWGKRGEGAPLALECTCRPGNDLARIAVIGWVLRLSSEQKQLVGLEQ